MSEFLKCGVVTSLLIGFLFAENIWRVLAGGVNSSLIEIAPVSRDPSTQWMLVSCLAIYFVFFLVLEWSVHRSRRPNNQAQIAISTEVKTFNSLCLSPLAAGVERVINPNLWLAALVGLTLLCYALDYETAVRSLQVLVLMTSLVFGKAMAACAVGRFKFRHLPLRATGRNQGAASHLGCGHSLIRAEKGISPVEVERETSRRIAGIIFTLVTLFAASALWQPDKPMAFQYHGIPRWNGVWDNPNLYGLLMGAGVVLKVCLATSNIHH